MWQNLNLLWMPLLVAIQLHRGQANILGLNQEQIQDIQKAKELLMRNGNYHAGFYDVVKDYLHEDYKKELDKKMGPAVEKEMLDTLLKSVDHLTDEDKLKTSLEPAKLNRFFKLGLRGLGRSIGGFFKKQGGHEISDLLQDAVSFGLDQAQNYAASDQQQQQQ